MEVRATMEFSRITLELLVLRRKEDCYPGSQDPLTRNMILRRRRVERQQGFNDRPLGIDIRASSLPQVYKDAL